VLLLALLAALGRSVRVSGRELAGSALLGVALLTFGVGIVHVAGTHIDSSIAAMIAGSGPLQAILWRRASGERGPLRGQATVVVGLVGLALIVLSPARGPAAPRSASCSCWARRCCGRPRRPCRLSRRITAPADPLLATAGDALRRLLPPAARPRARRGQRRRQRRSPPVNPIVAIAFGAALLGEELEWTTAIGTALVIGSVFVAVRRPRSPVPHRCASA
jgi:drug/metabolite transporter (DMT)-like permease